MIPACGLIDGTISMRYHHPKIVFIRSGTMFTVKTFLSLLSGAVTAQIGENHLPHLQKNSTVQDRVSLILLFKHKSSYFLKKSFHTFSGPMDQRGTGEFTRVPEQFSRGTRILEQFSQGERVQRDLWSSLHLSSSWGWGSSRLFVPRQRISFQI